MVLSVIPVHKISLNQSPLRDSVVTGGGAYSPNRDRYRDRQSRRIMEPGYKVESHPLA